MQQLEELPQEPYNDAPEPELHDPFPGIGRSTFGLLLGVGVEQYAQNMPYHLYSGPIGVLGNLIIGASAVNGGVEVGRFAYTAIRAKMQEWGSVTDIMHAASDRIRSINPKVTGGAALPAASGGTAMLGSLQALYPEIIISYNIS